eukprot:m.19851 g.19851  ORF g.19851 m.19851 type:complete len:80 (+) comp10964_c0_seq7:288-527(+)
MMINSCTTMIEVITTITQFFEVLSKPEWFHRQSDFFTVPFNSSLVRLLQTTAQNTTCCHLESNTVSSPTLATHMRAKFV